MQELTTYLITDITEATINTILSMQPLFPLKLRCSRQEIVNNLRQEQNISLFLEENKVIKGYVLAIPQDMAVEEYQHDDPHISKDPTRYYIDQVAVLPEERKGLAFLYLGYGLLEELGKRDINKVSSHLLTTNGVDKIIGKIFGPMSTERRIVHMPRYGDDPFEYMEVTYTKSASSG